MSKKNKNRPAADPSMPHDGIFKVCMSNLAIAEDFLRIHLPAAIQQQLDFTTLNLSSGSFVDEDIKQYCSDIVYSLKNTQGKDCYIYCLVEHQSSVDPLMPFRLLRYCLAVMQRHIDRHKTKKPLPLVVPLLFYHGVKRPYPHTHKMRFVDCFENVKLAEWLYHGPFPLVDITVIPDEEILTHRSVALLEAVQKHIQVRDDLLEVASLFSQALVASKPPRELFRQLVYYISRVGEVSDQKKFLEDITQTEQNYREDVMTIAQQLRQEGLQQGEQRKAFEIAKEMLAEGADFQFVKRVTKLSDEEMSQLRLH